MRQKKTKKKWEKNIGFYVVTMRRTCQPRTPSGFTPLPQPHTPSLLLMRQTAIIIRETYACALCRLPRQSHIHIAPTPTCVFSKYLFSLFGWNGSHCLLSDYHLFPVIRCYLLFSIFFAVPIQTLNSISSCRAIVRFILLFFLFDCLISFLLRFPRTRRL